MNVPEAIISYDKVGTSERLNNLLDVFVEGEMTISANTDHHGIGKTTVENCTIGEALREAQKISIPYNAVGSQWRRVFTPWGVLIQENYAQSGMRGTSQHFYLNEAAMVAILEAEIASVLAGETDVFSFHHKFTKVAISWVETDKATQEKKSRQEVFENISIPDAYEKWQYQYVGGTTYRYFDFEFENIVLSVDDFEVRVNDSATKGLPPTNYQIARPKA